MSCAMSLLDASYVLGALGPHERWEFERHLQTCTDCAQGVAELAGLPGLLRHVDESSLDPGTRGGASGNGEVAGGAVDGVGRRDGAVVPRQPAPRDKALVLPLTGPWAGDPSGAGVAARPTGPRRSRRRWRGPAAAAVLAALLGTGVTLASQHLPEPSGGTPGAEMRPSGPGAGVSGRALEADVRVVPTAWGTRVDLTCRYDPAHYAPGTPAPVLTLVVRARDGRQEQLGSWVARPDQTLHLQGASAVRAQDVSSVEVRSGRTALLVYRS